MFPRDNLRADQQSSRHSSNRLSISPLSASADCGNQLRGSQVQYHSAPWRNSPIIEQELAGAERT
jgi:hypothetical protein